MICSCGSCLSFVKPVKTEYRVTRQETAFSGSYARTPMDFEDTAHAIFNGQLGALVWIEELPVDGGPRALSDTYSGRMPVPKTFLKT
jgi:hypothetical protein